MKLLMIVYNEALELEVLELFERHGVENYTKWNKVFGCGQSSGPHLGTPVWPKANNVMAVLMEDQRIPAVLRDIRELRTRFAAQGLKALVLPVDEAT